MKDVDGMLPEQGFVLRHAIAQLLLWSSLYYLLPAILPHLLTDTGWSGVAVSGAMSGGFFFWAVLCPFAGGVVDRGRAGRAMKIAGLLGSLLLLLAAWAQSLWVACVALVFLGGPMAMTLYDPCFSIMVRRFGPQARRPITTVTLIAGFATLLTFPLVASLVSAGLDWRWVVAVFAGLALIAVAILPGDPDVDGMPRDTCEPSLVGTGNYAASKAIAIGIAFALVMFGHAVLLFQLPVQLMEASGASLALALPMILGPSQIAGRLAWEAVHERLPLETAALVLFGFMIMPPLVLGLGGGLATALAALVMQGAGYGVHTILRPLLAARWLPEPGFARRLGVIAMIGLLMMAAAPAAGAWMAGAFGLSGLLGLVLAADFTGFALLAGLVLRARQEKWV